MRILASHFALLPELRLVKYPKIYIDPSNTIDRIEHNDQGFVETPSTEFFGGLMIPGFIADLSGLQVSTTSKQLNLLLGRLYRDGIQYVIMPDVFVHVIDLQLNAGLSIAFRQNISSQSIKIEEVENPWQKLCHEVYLDKKQNVIDLLNQYLVQPWQNWNESLPGGMLQPGAKPGIMLINGIDWSSFTFTKSLTIQRLHGC